MPNALIQPGISGSQSTVTCPLYDPRFERENRVRFRRDAVPELDLANSFFNPAGRWPSRAWVLVRRGDYNNIDTFSNHLVLQLDDEDGFTPPVTFGGLTVVQAHCVSTGLISSPDAIYLVELTDARGILYSTWFQFPTTSQYNVRAPAYPERYYDGSLNAGTPWDWNGMVGNLWGQMGAFLGPYPGLPIAPAGSPENFSLPGTAAFKALCDILDLIGCTVTCDLTLASPYGIAFQGSDDPNFVALQAKYLARLEDDFDYVDAGSGRVPGFVVVLFHRRNQYYGTEETIRLDSFQWQITNSYAVTVAAPARFTGALGTHYIWDDFTVRYDIDNNPLPADVATATAIAAERTTQYYHRIYSGTVGYLRQVYTGVLPFSTGSLVEGVCWRQMFAANGTDTPPKVSSHRDTYKRAGFVTEVVRGSEPPWPEVSFYERQFEPPVA